MRPALFLLLTTLLLAGAGLTLGLRSAKDAQDVHVARRLTELDNALIGAAARSEAHTRELIGKVRRGPATARIPTMTRHKQATDEDVLQRRINDALRASPDVHKLVFMTPDRLAWRQLDADTETAIASADVDQLLALTVDGYAAGYWSRTNDSSGRLLPAPFPAMRVGLSTAARAAVLLESRTVFTQQLVVVALLVALVLLGASLLWLTMAREQRETRRRNAFLSAVTHELKTPIANISLYAETIREHGAEDTQRLPAFCDVILSEASRLRSRVQELLDVAAGALEGLDEEQVFDVTALLRERIARVPLDPPEADATPVMARAPKALVERAFDEVLRNAHKFAPDSPVRAAVEQRGREVMIAIQDRGPGIPTAERERVFEPFVRLGDAMTDAAGGTGLGLPLVRQCLEGCRGRVHIEPGGDGLGVRVVMHLPAAEETSAR